MLPAPAGMFPSAAAYRSPGIPTPRTRGDVPAGTSCRPVMHHCSTHSWGWSLIRKHTKAELLLRSAPAGMVPTTTSVTAPSVPALLPAPAGMIPTCRTLKASPVTAPRTRGGGPFGGDEGEQQAGCSLHPRGSSPAQHRHASRRLLLPGLAGMLPGSPAARPASWSPPCTRRDDSDRAQRKGQRCVCSPNRGDVPDAMLSAIREGICSPHPRGWSHHAVGEAHHSRLLPAPAGSVPVR
jgi:hypothetical protein